MGSGDSNPEDPLEAGLAKRDGRFLFRLFLLLGIGVLLGILVFHWLTGPGVAGCAADSFKSVTGG